MDFFKSMSGTETGENKIKISIQNYLDGDIVFHLTLQSMLIVAFTIPNEKNYSNESVPSFQKKLP